MATIPTMHTFATGEVATASNINNNTVSAFAYLSAPPLCCLRQTVAQSLGPSAATALLYDTEDIDSDNGHSTVSNTSRYTSQTAGWYEIEGGWTLVAGTATGRRLSIWAINGTQINGGQSTMVAGTSATGFGLGRTVFLNVGDYVELQALQDNGGSISTGSATGVVQAFMTTRWVHT